MKMYVDVSPQENVALKGFLKCAVYKVICEDKEKYRGYGLSSAKISNVLQVLNIGSK